MKLPVVYMPPGHGMSNSPEAREALEAAMRELRLPPCNHALTIDFEDWSLRPLDYRHRFCLLCGEHYNRTKFLEELREAIADRHRIKSSRIVFE